MSRAIGLAWVVAGTLDIVVASVYYGLTARLDVIRLLQGIASGVLGPRAFAGGFKTAVLGLVLHYVIALIWATFFFLVYPRVGLLSRSRLATAALYGALVSVVMTFVVLPLSNVRARPFVLSAFVVGTVILMFSIGLPLSFIGSRYYARHGRRGSGAP